MRTTPALDTTTSPPTVRGRTVRFNLCGSDDADAGDSLNWQFHFGDSGAPAFGPDGAFRPDFDHECRVEHTYREGTWIATLSVTDKHLEDQGRGGPSALARTTLQVRVVADAFEPEPAGPAGPTFRYIFVTSATFDGNLGGLGGADAKCALAAQSAGMPNPTAANYKAWLSDSAQSPATRFVQSSVPYRNVFPGSSPAQPGLVVANDWADLTDGSLQTALLTQSGMALAPSDRVWTHTLANGTAGGTLNVHCLDWNSPLVVENGDEGQAIATNANWTDFAAGTCNNAFRLVCVQQ